MFYNSVEIPPGATSKDVGGLLKGIPEWGSEPVPVRERVLGFADLFVLWSSLGVGMLVLLAGGILTLRSEDGGLALGMPQVLLITVLGSVVGSLLLALAGLVGTRHGVPTMVSLRPLLGLGGSYLPTALNVLQLIGWTSFELMIMAHAATVASGFVVGPGTPFLWLVLFTAWCALLALGGPLVVIRKYLEKFAIWLVYGSTAWITYQVVTHLGNIPAGSLGWKGGAPILLGLDLVIAMPISWWPLVSDYNRFSRSPRRGAASTFLGYTIANVWFFALGAALVFFSPDQDVISSIVLLSFGLVALLPILVDETDNGFANIYSAAVSVQNAFPRLRQRRLLLVISAAGAAAAAYLLNLGLGAAGVYENFLLLIGALFVPLLGVLTIDSLVLRRSDYANAEFYPSARTVRPLSLVSWFTGILVYWLIAPPPFLPISLNLQWLGASLPSFGAAALSNWTLARAAARLRARRAAVVTP